MGIANLIGDGISMALGDFISTKSEAEFTINERNREAWEVENNPDGEKREMIDIYKVWKQSEILIRKRALIMMMLF